MGKRYIFEEVEEKKTNWFGWLLLFVFIVYAAVSSR